MLAWCFEGVGVVVVVVGVVFCGCWGGGSGCWGGVLRVLGWWWWLFGWCFESVGVVVVVVVGVF